LGTLAKEEEVCNATVGAVELEQDLSTQANFPVVSSSGWRSPGNAAQDYAL